MAGGQPKAVQEAAREAQYAELLAARQALEAVKGQGRPQLRTEQRSTEKILSAAGPLAARSAHGNAAAAAPAPGQPATDTQKGKAPAQPPQPAGRENDPQVAGYAQQPHPAAAAARRPPAARVPRPAFRPGGTTGWPLGQPTASVRSSAFPLVTNPATERTGADTLWIIVWTQMQNSSGCRVGVLRKLSGATGGRRAGVRHGACARNGGSQRRASRERGKSRHCQGRCAEGRAPGVSAHITADLLFAQSSTHGWQFKYC